MAGVCDTAYGLRVLSLTAAQPYLVKHKFTSTERGIPTWSESWHMLDNIRKLDDQSHIRKRLPML